MGEKHLFGQAYHPRIFLRQTDAALLPWERAKEAMRRLLLPTIVRVLFSILSNGNVFLVKAIIAPQT